MRVANFEWRRTPSMAREGTGRPSLSSESMPMATSQLKLPGTPGEDRYRLVIDNLREVVFQTDPQGRWSFLNPAWKEITGFGVEETLGKSFLDSIHP